MSLWRFLAGQRFGPLDSHEMGRSSFAAPGFSSVIPNIGIDQVQTNIYIAWADVRRQVKLNSLRVIVEITTWMGGAKLRGIPQGERLLSGPREHAVATRRRARNLAYQGRARSEEALIMLVLASGWPGYGVFIRFNLSA